MRQFVQELLEGVQRIENERTLLNEELKELYKAYEDKIDVKAFKVALRISKAKEKFSGSDMELDNILEAMN